MEAILGTFGAVLASAVAALLIRRWRMGWSAVSAAGPDGYQEAIVTINGQYRPSEIFVTLGTPVRLRFRRLEDDSCSERVIFSGIGIERRLPAFQETLIEFVPHAPGEFLFTCQWGMYRGKLVVRPAPKRRIEAQTQKHLRGE